MHAIFNTSISTAHGRRRNARRRGAFRRGLSLAVALLASAGAGSVFAQQPSAADPRAHATRAELERAAVDAERESQNPRLDEGDRRWWRAEAEAIRTRLREGDFRPGDRVVLAVRGDTALTDTFTVRAGDVLRLPGVGDIPLGGVLRAELQTHLQESLARYIRDPQIQTEALVRLAVLGEVGQPGFYWLPADVQLSDAIMVAGGPTQAADLDRTVVRRNGEALFRGERARELIARGRTIDQLNLRAGDEVVIGERRQRNWLNWLQAAGVILGIVVTIYGGTRVF